MTRHADLLALILILAVALAAAAPLWGPGIVNTRGGGDSPFLLQRLHQMTANLRAGVFPVRWMPDAAYGLGYPFFSYYAALPYYIGGLLALLGLDLITATQITQTLGFVAAALAMYGWTRRHAKNPLPAWLAAVAYTVAPFHLVNVYVRGDSLSEFYAFIFYPLILWALDADNRPGTALAYAGLLLTHNISAFIFTPFVLLYVLIRRRPDTRVLKDLGSLTAGLMISAWFWLPALAESSLVQLGTVTQGYFHYTNHFRALNLVQNRPLFDYSVASPSRTPFAMGLPQAVGAVLGGTVLLARLLQRLERTGGFILLGLALSTLMITPLSKPLWDYLPLLPMVQFPWRFLSVQALFAAAATAAPFARPLTYPASRTSFYFQLFIALTVAAILILSVLLPLHPDRLPIGPEDITAERLLLYELFTSNIGTTIRHEYLFRDVVPRPFTSDALIEPEAPPRAIPLDGARVEAVIQERAPTRQVWRVSGEGGGVAFPLLYWPGWRATVDSAPVEVQPVLGSGLLSLVVPPGDHTVTLYLGRTPVRAATESLSLVTLLGIVLMVVRRLVRRPSGRWALILLPLCLLATGRYLSSPIPLSGHLDLTMDFVQMPYLHHNPGGVRFEAAVGRVWLAWYDLSDETPAPGDVLTVTVKMDAAFPYTVTLEMVSPAAVRYDISPLAEASCEFSLCILTVPPDISRGLYLLRLRVFGPDGEMFARTPKGEPMGTLYLAPVRVTEGPLLSPEAPVLAPFGPAIRLYEAAISQPAPDRLAVRLTWGIRHPVAVNYGISLRLRDADGQTVTAMDTQPGYGFLPTSLWRPGEAITDRYEIPLPPDTPSGEGYTLEVVLYQVPTLASTGQAVIGPFPIPLKGSHEQKGEPRRFSLPLHLRPLGVIFDEQIRLAGYNLEREADTLRVTLWWQALEVPKTDYTVFVHLFDPTTQRLVAQNDAPPRRGAYPTSWWVAGEVVSDTVTLSLQGVPPGEYRLAVGLYEYPSGVRLRARTADGAPIPDDRPVLPEAIIR